MKKVILICLILLFVLIGLSVWINMTNQQDEKDEQLIAIPQKYILTPQEEIELENKAIIDGDDDAALRLYFYYSSYLDDWKAANPWLCVLVLLGRDNAKIIYKKSFGDFGQESLRWIFKQDIGNKAKTKEASLFFKFMTAIVSSEEPAQSEIAGDVLRSRISNKLIDKSLELIKAGKSLSFESFSVKRRIMETTSMTFSFIFEPAKEYSVPENDLTAVKQFFIDEIKLTNEKRYKGGPFVSYHFIGKDGSKRMLSFILIAESKTRFMISGIKPRFMVQDEKNTYVGDIDIDSAMKLFRRMFTDEIYDKIQKSDMLRGMPYSCLDFTSLRKP